MVSFIRQDASGQLRPVKACSTNEPQVTLLQCTQASESLGCPQVAILNASESVEATRTSLSRIQTDMPRIPVILTVDGTRPDIRQFLDLPATDFHDVRLGPALLEHRVQQCLKTHTVQQISLTSRLAEEECAVWSSLFNSAGTGLLKGHAKGFLAKQREWFDRLDMLVDEVSDWEAIVLDCMKAIQWELNNHYASTLLDLQEPVSLNAGFISRLRLLDAQRIGPALLNLDQDKPTLTGHFAFDRGDEADRHLSIEITIPNNLDDVLLMTIVDITQQVRLESELRRHVQLLEERVEERTKAIRQVNHELERESHQRQRLTQQVRGNLVHITQGIISAKKILEVALTGKEELRRVFPEAILIERPMDIMGGDFLFTAEKDGRKTLALIDSTGHGIPGAMVSLMGSTMINKAFVSVQDQTPSDILDLFHSEFSERMRSGGGKAHMYGFDAGILTLDPERSTLEFAGARGDLYLVRNGQTQIFRGTRGSIELSPIGGPNGQRDSYALHTITVEPGDQFYMITDGIRDQFGGTSNRKMGRKRLADILSRHAALPPIEREKALQQSLLIWKGANAKVDDATLVGIQC